MFQYIGSDAGGTTTLLGNIEFGSNGAGTINVWRPLTPQYSPSAITNNNQIGYVGTGYPGGMGLTNGVENFSANIPFGSGVWLISSQFDLQGTMSPVYQYQFRIYKDTTRIFTIGRGGDRIDNTLDYVIECATVVFTGPCNIKFAIFLNCGFSGLTYYPTYTFARIA